jgi:hypothetical protein
VIPMGPGAGQQTAGVGAGAALIQTFSSAIAELGAGFRLLCFPDLLYSPLPVWTTVLALAAQTEGALVFATDRALGVKGILCRT